MPERLIINAALTGNVPTKAQNPYVPITAEEIVEDCERCVAAGAAIVHLHARDADGRPTTPPNKRAETITKAVFAATGVQLAATLGLVLIYVIGRRALDRRRYREWDIAWALADAKWRRRQV